jgi:DUF438 domain-containing protein
MRIAGELTEAQAELLFAHLPVGMAVTDVDDTIRFWAGATFVDCNPKLIGRDIHGSHPKRARESLTALLDSFKSGEEDVVDRIEESSLGFERFVYAALRDESGAYRGVLQTVLPVEWTAGGGRVPTAGRLTHDLLALVLAHMPVSLGLADEDGVLRFWAGEAFSTCDPDLIGRDLVHGHAERNRPGVTKLLEELESGASDEVSTDEGAEHVVYTALRDDDGVYRGVLETVVARKEQACSEQ